ncbi:hypothetical protein CesoFtcFv8_025291 [Champsocephalus esox]|uniref:Uncharacterized protein n=1 Tax=Champsocephalus esox TaxID=159716 RepID=A0AAN8B470_9TELE|nr:hypothetical protein CesoFtcFv8_025291 [Champsocephalus esox]
MRPHAVSGGGEKHPGSAHPSREECSLQTGSESRVRHILVLLSLTSDPGHIWKHSWTRTRGSFLFSSLRAIMEEGAFKFSPRHRVSSVNSGMSTASVEHGDGNKIVLFGPGGSKTWTRINISAGGGGLLMSEDDDAGANANMARTLDAFLLDNWFQSALY